MSRRIIFYYQTPTDLSPILQNPSTVTHIHLASIHFGTETDGQPYIHLNNLYPDNTKFNVMWQQLQDAYDDNVKIILMVGGAGGGFQTLFNNYTTAYGQLRDLVRRHPIITGIDLDIEESVTLDNVKKLINSIKTDFPDPEFIVTMAPVQGSLQSDSPGMGGFVYKDLYNSPEGQYISYFNGQFYGDFSVQAYQQCVANGYPASKVVMGSMSGTGSIDVVQQLSTLYTDFGGVFSWEYCNTTPTPIQWSTAMHATLYGVLWSILRSITRICPFF